MRIICDVDCVLNDLIFKMLNLYNARSGKNIQVDDITAYEFDKCLSQNDANALTSMFKEKYLWDSLEPMPYSQVALNKILQSGHDIYLATATDPVNFEWKCNWIYKYYPFIDQSNIIRINDKGLLNGDVIIDDCYDQLIRCMYNRIVFDYPWNRSEELDYVYDVRRASNWNDIINILNNIEEEERKWKMDNT